ncbi:aldehyde dehydrogenase family protein [Bauldia litoralis]|uniref:Lactaldehyde dehydrogenase / glycolaldehyde dehydrogenase n=1 Tax=Bauldia litoralis TaxID=665467 RepID=A0A1G6DVH8_9HYPH|nr:aldehyde dehydrogenase family protein [Bauldia litoralis]SDB49120.1 lactaldehyde dehydrogenase / glycolaldehyde dehydrogenase [Bauldia litoralis]
MSAMKELVKGTDRYTNYIDGGWEPSTVKEWLEVENPATGAIIASVPRGSEDDADRAVVAAYRAQPAWEATPPIERAELLKKLARLILENRERLAQVVIAEQGKPLQEARGEIEGAALYLSYAAEEARRITGDIIPSDNPDEQIWIQRVAHGVVIALTAWNYPAALMTRKIGPALIAGNTVVVKSHEGTPISALEIAQLADQAGFPAGVINVISGTGEGVGQALVKHPLARLVTLTGSVRAGKAVFRAGADDLKVLRLELGGKAPFIVGEDADVGAAVRAAVVSRFENCGQICICNERMYLHEKIADEFLDKFVRSVKALKVGDPTKLVDVGPKFSGPEVDKVEAMVDAATAAGAEVLTGGGRLTEGEFAKGHWFDPTVLRVNDNAMAIMQDEVFGPVVPVMTVTDFDEGLRLANESRYGLSAYVFTKDLRRMMRLVRELKFGEIYVNRGGGDVVHAHHAGMRDSGLGGEDGKYGLDGYFQKKTIYVNYA